MTIDFKMKKGFLPHLTYSLVLPLFFLGSALLYNPFDIKGYYSFGQFYFGFHLVMISCIILLCSVITRGLLYLVLRKKEYTWWNYIIWCAGEAMIMSSFAALYTFLFKNPEGGYLTALTDCMKFIFLTLVYPYLFLSFVRALKIQREELEKKDMPQDNSLLRFYDEHKRLKLTISPSSILFVKSEFNYVKIHYLDGGKVKYYMLRASMKSLEKIDSKNLVRCQRSFFVNPEHVSVLRKDPEGFIYAEMNVPDLPSVSVSKQYYEALSALL